MKSTFICKDYLQLGKAKAYTKPYTKKHIQKHTLPVRKMKAPIACTNLSKQNKNRNRTANIIHKLLTRGDHQASIFCSIIKYLYRNKIVRLRSTLISMIFLLHVLNFLIFGESEYIQVDVTFQEQIQA